MYICIWVLEKFLNGYPYKTPFLQYIHINTQNAPQPILYIYVCMCIRIYACIYVCMCICIVCVGVLESEGVLATLRSLPHFVFAVTILRGDNVMFPPSLCVCGYNSMGWRTAKRGRVIEGCLQWHQAKFLCQHGVCVSVTPFLPLNFLHIDAYWAEWITKLLDLQGVVCDGHVPLLDVVQLLTDLKLSRGCVGRKNLT